VPPGVGSDHADVLRLITLATRADIELDGLALLEGTVARSLNVAVVDEDVIGTLAGDEAVALLGIEKLHGSCRHVTLYLFGAETLWPRDWTTAYVAGDDRAIDTRPSATMGGYRTARGSDQ
jgi:hypothetical protein